MSEPRFEDDVAMGKDEFCGSCECLVSECACGQPDTVEEARFEK